MRATLFCIAFVLGVYALHAQITISGNVTNERGVPLQGANVLILEENLGDATNDQGAFLIEGLKPGSHNIRISFVGYVTLQKSIAVSEDQRYFEFQLSESAFQFDELIVRSTRAGEKTPMAYTNLDKETIEKNNLGQDVPYLLRWTPSTVVTSDAGTGIGYTGIRIRGTDPTRINVTINGVPLNDAESQGVFWVDLPDFITSTDNVQIQRGVGTSTVGTGAFGGAINLNTNKLETAPYAQLSATAGSFNTFKRNVQFGSGLLKGKFAFEGRLSEITSDGFVDRARADLSSYFFSGAYMSDRTSLRFNTFSGHEVTYQAWFGIPPSFLEDEALRKTNFAGTEKPGEPYEDQVDDYEQTHYQLHINHKLDQSWNVNGALFYIRGAGFFEEYAADQLLDSYDLPDLTIGNETITNSDLVRRRWLDNDFYGANFSVNCSQPADGPEFTIGGGYNIYEGRHFGEVIWAEIFNNEQLGDNYYDEDARKSDFTIFAKFNQPFSEEFSGYLDLQYRNIDYELMGFDNEGFKVPQQQHYDFFNPKAGLFYQPDQSTHYYVSVAFAHREPNRNDFLGRSVNDPPSAEKLYDFELGGEIQGRKALLGANLYYMLYRDQLALSGEINNNGEFTRINIDRSYRLGLELMTQWQPLDRFTFRSNLTWSRNKVAAFTEEVDTYDDSFNKIGVTEVSHDDTDLSFSPDLIFDNELTYQLLPETKDADLDFSLLTKYVGKQYIDNTSDEDNVLDPYIFSDLRLTFRLDEKLAEFIQLTVLVRNLFDAKFETNAWSYRSIFLGDTALDQGFYPQAGRNILVGFTVGF